MEKEEVKPRIASAVGAATGRRATGLSVQDAMTQAIQEASEAGVPLDSKEMKEIIQAARKKAVAEMNAPVEAPKEEEKNK